MVSWHFDTPSPWSIRVCDAPRGAETDGRFFGIAVPEIAGSGRGPASVPCVVVARVTAEPWRIPPQVPGRTFFGQIRGPASPRSRAKTLLDALHDGRDLGPKYAGLGAMAPLPDDDPRYVHGLAVEVQAAGDSGVEYRLGPSLQVVGRLLMEPIEVHVPAPNDIPADSAEKIRIDAARALFLTDLVRGIDRKAATACASKATCLLIRHRPQRDEDNTWATWASALTGGGVWSRALWPSPGSPFAGWSPMAMASLADPGLPCEVRYEVYGDV